MPLQIIIDMQEGFRFTQTEAILPQLRVLLDRFTVKKVFTRFVDRPGSGFETVLHWTEFQDKRNQELLAELRDIAATVEIFDHTTYSIFTHEMNDELAVHDGPVYLSGIFTDVCIQHTALELFDRGREVFVLEDICASPNDRHNPHIHRAALEMLRHAIGEDHVISSDSLIKGGG